MGKNMGVCKTTEKTETWEVCNGSSIFIDLDANINIWIKKDGEILSLEKYIERIIELKQAFDRRSNYE